MERSITLAAILCAYSSICAQITFDRAYGDDGGQLGQSVQQTLDGGYILSGRTSTGDQGGTDMYVIKVDGSGTEQWSRTYGTAGWDVAFSVQEATSGGYIICGVFNGLGTDSLTLIRTDAIGAVQWEHQFPGNLGRSIGYCVRETADGGFVATGFEGIDFATDVFLLKVDADGVQQWRSVVDLGASEYGGSVATLQDGGFAVLADNGEIGFAGDLHLIRFDPGGDTLWTKGFGTSDHDHAHGLCRTNDGGYMIAGGTGYPDRNILLIRVDEMGNQVWQRIHGEPDLDELASDVQQLDNSGFVIGGRKENSVTGGTEMHLFTTDVDGLINWERTFIRGVFSEGLALDRCADGGFVLFGNTVDTFDGTGDLDMHLVKTDANGVVGLEDARGLSSALEVFPNPANERITICTTDDLIREIVVVDVRGGRVAERSYPLVRTAELDTSDLAEGIYSVVATPYNGPQRVRSFVVVRDPSGR